MDHCDLIPPLDSNNQGTLQHKFTEAGVFPVTMSAFNDISSINKSLLSFIYVQNEVQGVSLLDHSYHKQVKPLVLLKLKQS